MSIITASRKELATALKHGASIVEKSGIEVLNNVKLSAARGQLRLAFTDTSLWLSVAITADADAITATTLPAVLLSQAVAAMEGDEIKIDVSGTRATVSCGRARFKLPVTPADQFPPSLDVEAGISGYADRAALGSALDAVSYAAPAGISNHAQAVRFDAVDGEINLIALDGLRMAHDVVNNSGEEFPAFSLPTKACAALARLCGDGEAGDVTIRASDRLATFSIGPWTLTSKLIEGDFMAYAAAIDERPGDPVWFDPRQMERALGRLALLTDQYSRGVKVDLSADKITLTLTNQKSSEGFEEIPAAYGGQPQTVGYSLSFLRDALRKVPGDDAEMFISSPVKRAILLARNVSGTTHLIGPMQV